MSKVKRVYRSQKDFSLGYAQTASMPMGAIVGRAVEREVVWAKLAAETPAWCRTLRVTVTVEALD